MASKKNSTTPVAVVKIVERASSNPKLVAEAEILFSETAGIMAGMKVTGFAIWRSEKSEGGLFVTLPGKKGTRGRYFDTVRPTVGGQGLRKAFTATILDTYREQLAKSEAAAQ